MEILIDLINTKKARNLRKMLLSVPFEDKIHIRIVRSTKIAQKRCKRHNVDCVIYSREHTEALESYFDDYIYPPKWFLPYSVTDNKNDVIDAINSYRTAYYIIEPLDYEKAAQALKCIKMRIK